MPIIPKWSTVRQNIILSLRNTLKLPSEGEKKIERGEAGLAKVSRATAAPQWSFNWTPFVSKLNISVWAFKNLHKGGEREGKKRQRGGKQGRISSSTLFTQDIWWQCLIKALRWLMGSLPPPEQCLFKPAIEWKLIRESVGTQAYSLTEIHPH